MAVCAQRLRPAVGRPGCPAGPASNGDLPWLRAGLYRRVRLDRHPRPHRLARRAVRPLLLPVDGQRRLRARNHALAVAAAGLLVERWETEVGAPPAMLGAMAVVRLPGRHPATPAAARAVHDRLWQKYHIEVPVMSLEQALWVRVSAQIYNDLE